MTNELKEARAEIERLRTIHEDVMQEVRTKAFEEAARVIDDASVTEIGSWLVGPKVVKEHIRALASQPRTEGGEG